MTKKPVSEAISVSEQLMSQKEAAERLELSERAVGDLLRAGKLQGHKKGKRWYVLFSDILTYIKS